jgi:hypothetical protein
MRVTDGPQRHSDHDPVRRRRRPSPALVIALVALFVSLGGTSYAAITITGGNVKNGTLSSADVKNNSLTSADIKNGSLQFRDFRSGELPTGGGGRGGNGTQGAPGAPGAAGSALGFARVAANGALDPTATKNVALVSKPAPGLYCLNLTTGTATSIQMTIDNSGADPSKTQVGGTAAPAAVAGACPAGSDILVATSEDLMGFIDRPFYLAVIG